MRELDAFVVSASLLTLAVLSQFYCLCFAVFFLGILDIFSIVYTTANNTVLWPYYTERLVLAATPR